MSLAKLLDYTGQTYGRGGDSTLVHMSKGEVDALQTLARTQGKQLTKNPTTGLPEAFVLAGLLPAIAGAGATAAGLSPLLAAGVVGGGTALLTGSLEKGLTAGLGAYGGAGLGAGLSNVGSTAAATQQGAATLAGAGANAATNAALPNLANVAAAPGLNTASMMGAESLAAPAMSAPMAQAAQAPLLGGSMPQQMANIAERYPIQQPSFQDSFMGNINDMGGGLQQLFSSPNAPMGLSGESALDRMGGITGAGTNALMAATPLLYSSPEDFEEDRELDPDRGYIRPYTFHRNRIEDAAPGERKFDQYFEEHAPVRPEVYDGVKRFAEGGRAALMTAEDMWRRDIQGALRDFQESGGGGGGGMGKHSGKQVIEFSRTPVAGGDGRRYEQTYTTRDMTPEDIALGRTAYEPGLEYDGAGNPIRNSTMGRGLGSLGPMGIPEIAGSMYGNPAMLGVTPQSRSMYGLGFAQGGMLEGPGDGLSDSIPAVIDGVQPAALSTDEFVIPADVVSALGNGSSDAGAQELYAMMDRIRERAHGKKKQQKKVNAKAVLPK